MVPMQEADCNELEFFGVKLKVRNAHLAALLNSDVTEDVQVIGRRARAALKADDEATPAGSSFAGRVLQADDSVVVRAEETAEEP
jgi:hypothetical protein